jgi:hypothetical protein
VKLKYRYVDIRWHPRRKGAPLFETARDMFGIFFAFRICRLYVCLSRRNWKSAMIPLRK